MPSIEKLQKRLDNIYQAHINLPVDFHFISSICGYVKEIEKSDLLKEFIEAEHLDLKQARYKIPKATTDRQYETMVRILDEKLYTNCSEDYMELVFVSEAIEELKDKVVAEDIASMNFKEPHSQWDLIQYGIWEFLNNRPTQKNYYIQNGQIIKNKWQKVHRYLMGQLSNPSLQYQIDQRKVEKQLKLAYVNGVLIIQGKQILIKAQKRDTEEHRMLEYIFTDKKTLGKPNSYADIAEKAFADYGYDSNKKKWRKYYDICQRVNSKIPSKITDSLKGKVKDFLIATSESGGKVRINEEFV